MAKKNNTPKKEKAPELTEREKRKKAFFKSLRE
jgi:hypothetical protein